MPTRHQRKRTRGWRTPLDEQGRPAVYVGRGTRFGNPAAIGLWVSAGTNWASAERCAVSKWVATREEAAVYFRLGMKYGGLVVEGHDKIKRAVPLPSLEEIRTELAGRDLLCWCPIDQPCHADTLLALADTTKEARL